MSWRLKVEAAYHCGILNDPYNLWTYRLRNMLCSNDCNKLSHNHINCHKPHPNRKLDTQLDKQQLQRMLLSRLHNTAYVNLRRMDWLCQTNGLEVIINANYNTHSSLILWQVVLLPSEQSNKALHQNQSATSLSDERPRNSPVLTVHESTSSIFAFMTSWFQCSIIVPGLTVFVSSLPHDIISHWRSSEIRSFVVGTGWGEAIASRLIRVSVSAWIYNSLRENDK